MPGATWRPLPENETQSKIRPTQIILHTAVDAPGPTRLERYFARVDVTVESHFWVPLHRDIVQMMDTEVRADANYRANRRADGTGAISIETEDEGDPIGVPWTKHQIDAIVAILLWAHIVHGIPMVKCAGPASPGIGYHAMWGAPSAWTPARGKTCPGPTRIAQFRDTILPRVQGEQETGMNEDQARDFANACYGAIVHRPADQGGLDFWTERFTGMTYPDALAAFVAGGAAEAADLQERVRVLEAEIEAIKQTPLVDVNVDVDINTVANEVAEIIVNRLAS
jgi:hypothetical protein